MRNPAINTVIDAIQKEFKPNFDGLMAQLLDDKSLVDTSDYGFSERRTAGFFVKEINGYSLSVRITATVEAIRPERENQPH